MTRACLQTSPAIVLTSLSRITLRLYWFLRDTTMEERVLARLDE
jgi:hypothetical protein